MTPLLAKKRYLTPFLAWVAAIASIGAVAAGIETWKEDTAAAFQKGKRDGATISDQGRIRLARKLVEGPKLDAVRVWDLAKSPDGTLYAASGDEGKVYRRSRDAWEVAADSEDTQVLSLVSFRNGKILAGTGPSGLVVDVTDPASKPHRLGPGVLYVWDLAADPAENVYAATGPQGQLWKRSADGAWSMVFDAPQSHLLSLAIAPDGSVFAGSDGEGIVYRIGPNGKVTAVFDAPQNEIKALAIGPDGSIYAGTGAESPASPPAGRPLPGDNAVYRISADGSSSREVWKGPKTMVLALAWEQGQLLAGTGPDGLLYSIDVENREATPLVKIDHGQVLALLADGDGVWLGAGDTGAVYRLESAHAASGTFTSGIHDAKLISRFGAASWKSDRPTGTNLTIQVRSGNVGEPDSTWSEWSSPLVDSQAGTIRNGRFAQYRATLTTSDPGSTPTLRSFAIRYRSANLAPELTKVEIPDLTMDDGTPRKGKLAIKWEASDPNGDTLAYSVQLRKEGWPAWIPLNEKALTDKTYELDLAAIPDGIYRVRVQASDRPSNDHRESLTKELTSEPFVVDHRSPSIGLTREREKITAKLHDDATRIASAEFSIDGGDWNPLFPTDGLFDTGDETVSIALPSLKPGMHLLMVRANDAAGNIGTADLVFQVP